MRKFSLAIAVLGSAFSVLAQNCSGSPPPATFAVRDPFAASFYYGNTTNNSYNLMFDMVVQSPISITAMRGTSYDQNGGTPNQIGATTTVNVYSIAGTWTGNTASNALWTLLGSGTLTVSQWAGESPISFPTPIQVPAGTFGMAIEVLPTTSGPAPGSVHCVGVSPITFPIVSDQFLTVSNQGIQQTGWTSATPTGVNVAGINLKMDYTPAAASALWTTLGEGCYFRPRGFYELFTAPIVAPDLENTSITMLPSTGPSGPNYVVISSGIPYVTPVGTAATAAAVGGMDDGLFAPITLPFTFAFPGGTTSVVTPGTNGNLLLASTNVGNRGAPFYGALGDLRDYEPRIAAFWADLDLTPAVSPTLGGFFYETDNATFARFSWDRVAEWVAANNGPLNSLQITLWNDGHVDISYGDLGLSTAGNNACVGWHDGNGARLPAGPTDLSATMPFTSGDGSIPPILGMSARPILGTTTNLVTTNLSAGTNFQVMIAALGGVAPPGVSLAPFGMPGCAMYVNQALIVSSFLDGSFSVPFIIPNDPSFQNVQFFFQSAPLTAGLNVAGLLTSNGVCAKLGL